METAVLWVLCGGRAAWPPTAQQRQQEHGINQSGRSWSVGRELAPAGALGIAKGAAFGSSPQDLKVSGGA